MRRHTHLLAAGALLLPAFFPAESGAETAYAPLPSMSDVARAVPGLRNKTAHVWLSITQDAQNAYAINDPFLRVRLSASAGAGGDFRFSGSAGDAAFQAYVRPDLSESGSYRFDGEGIWLDLKRTQGPLRDYTIIGTLEEDGRTKPVNWTLRRDQDRGGYSVEAPGASLRIEMKDRYEIHGSIQLAQFGKKSLACLTAAATMIIDAGQRPVER